MDLLKLYLEGCSLYIHQLTYDLNERQVRLVCVNNSDDRVPLKRLDFANVFGFSEAMFDDALDDSLIDSVIGIHVTPDGAYCLHTEKRELLIRVGTDPISQFI